MMDTQTVIRIFVAAMVSTGIVFFGAAGAFAQQGPNTQVTVNNNADDLAEALLGDTGPTSPITVTNAQYTGDFEAVGTFQDGPFGLDEGIAISAGRIDDMPYTGSWYLSSTGFGTPGHSRCDELTSPYTSQDAAVLTLTFDVSSTVDGIELEYVVASDEYPSFVGQEYNDGFGVFLNGVNVALDNNGNDININGPFFSSGTVLEYPDSESNFEGSTPRLSSAADITPGSTGNTLEVVICDAFDDVYDTAAFLSAFDGCIGDCEGTAICGDGIVQSGEQCDLNAFDPAYAQCPDGYEGSPMCNNDPDNPQGDGSCTVDEIPYGCTPIDYCADASLNSCSEFAICIDTYPPPGYDCECIDGYVGDGFSCTKEIEIEGPEDGELTNNNTPTITGTGEPGEEVTIYVDGEEIGTTEIDEDGDWEFEPDEELDDGEVVIVAEDPFSSDEVTIEIDTEAPTVAIDSPEDGAVYPESPDTIEGTVDDETAEVIVYVNGEPVGTAEVDEDGHWSIDVDDELDEGTHVVEAVATDEAGNQMTDEIEFGVSFAEDLVILQPSEGDVVRTDRPTVSGDGEPGSEVDIYVDGELVDTVEVDDDGHWQWQPEDSMDDGEVTVTARTETPVGEEQDDSVTFEIDTSTEDVVIESPSDGDLISDSRPEIRGSAAPGAEVTVTVDGEVECVVTADVNGHWSCTPDEELDDGEVVAEAEADDDGFVTDDVVTFEIDTEPPPIAIERPEDEELVAPTGVVVEGTAEPGAEVDVYLDGDHVGTATADEDGQWQLELDELDEGEEYEVVARTEDEAGNEADDDVRFFVEELEVDEFEGYMTGGGPNCAATHGDTGILLVLAILAGLLGVRRRRC